MKLLGQGYNLYIFHQGDTSGDEDGPRTGKISNNILKTHIKHDRKVWHIYPNASDYLPDEIGEEEEYFEGTRNSVVANSYERNKDVREACVKIHGYKCKACDFDLERKYGDHGKGFVYVHYIVPLNMIEKHYKVNPEHDLMPLCPNCHTMVYHSKNNELDLEKLRELISSCR